MAGFDGSSRDSRHTPEAAAPTVLIQRHLSGWAMVCLVLLLTVGFFGWALRGSGPSPLFQPDARPRPVGAATALGRDELEAVDLFDRVTPSVTRIRVKRCTADPARAEDSGTGVVWNEAGYVVTNVHLVQDAVEILVGLPDGSTWEARRVGCDYSNDLAVVKIEAPPAQLSPIVLGSSADLRVGQRVYAIGHPFGLEHTLTSGMVSGLHREILSACTQLPIYEVIQTDAAINPGNSGGPLLDSSGRLIGLNTAVAGDGTHIGVAFAVPVDTINRVVPQLLRQGHPERAGLGIRIDPDGRSNRQFHERFGTDGVVIFDVEDGSAAAVAGLRPTQVTDDDLVVGDLIRSIDGIALHHPNDLRRLLDAREAGETVEIEVSRFEGRRCDEVQLTVELQSLPPEHPVPLES